MEMEDREEERKKNCKYSDQTVYRGNDHAKLILTID